MICETVLTGREFISMIRPLLKIEQEKIRAIQINADVNSAVMINIECFGQSDGNEITVNELEPLDNMESMRFEVLVKRIDDEAEKM